MSASRRSSSRFFTWVPCSDSRVFRRRFGRYVDDVAAYVHGEAFARLWLEGHTRRLAVPMRGSTIGVREISATRLGQFFAKERLSHPELRDYRQQTLAVAGDPAVGRVITIPARLRIEEIEVRQFEL